MKFLVDNQLPPALARMIVTELNAEAAHVTDIGLRDAPDAALWTFAAQNDLILISKDEDFARLAMHDAKAGLLGSGLATAAKRRYSAPSGTCGRRCSSVSKAATDSSNSVDTSGSLMVVRDMLGPMF